MTTILNGIQSSGDLHLGNYFGSIKACLDLQNNTENKCLYFIADLHSFTSNRDAVVFKENQKNCVLDWLALGLDPRKSIFYRQSDITAHTELAWYLSCVAPIGLLERSHAFKDKKSKGLEANVGLFTYPILMAADILLYSAKIIPVGKDQKQHIEIARDLADKFNNEFGETFVVPEQSELSSGVDLIIGLDGQKMSKSYSNTIEIFAEEKVLKKKIMSIKTDSIELGKPLNPETCTVFAFHKLFKNPELEQLRSQYINGVIGFGDSKKQLFGLIWEFFRDARELRKKLEIDPIAIENILYKGAKEASKIANNKLSEVRQKLGLSKKSILQNLL